MTPQFTDLPDHLQAQIATEWGVLEHEAGEYFDTTTAAWRWLVICAFAQTDHVTALQTYLATADAITLRDLGHLLISRSRALEAAA